MDRKPVPDPDPAPRRARTDIERPPQDARGQYPENEGLEKAPPPAGAVDTSDGERIDEAVRAAQRGRTE